MLTFAVVFAVIGGTIVFFASAASNPAPTAKGKWWPGWGFWYQSPNSSSGSINSAGIVVAYPTASQSLSIKPTATAWKQAPAAYGGFYYQEQNNTITYTTINSLAPPASPPPATGTGFGQRPPFTPGVLSYPQLLYFNAEWPKWSSVGWCIINHESRSDGMYTSIQDSQTAKNVGPATGAFQVQGGYSGSEDTWKSFMGYKYAALAPPDVQWEFFFQTWADGAHASNWNGTHCGYGT